MPRNTVHPATHRHRPTSLVPLVLLAAAFAPGCTSVLSTASLPEMLRTRERHATEAAAGIADDGPSSPLDESGEDRATDEERRAAAIDETVSRLARLGHLDETARATLLATLERTEQEDWPAVVEAFAESLPAVELASSELQDEREPRAELEPETLQMVAEAAPVHVVAKADLDAPAEAGEPAPEPLAERPPHATPAPPPPAPATPPHAAAPEVAANAVIPVPVLPEPPAAEPAASSAPPIEPEGIASATAGLTINNAAFASRVQAWGVLDRFARDRFQPGQDVIVYFELDGLSAGESAAGHTTCIDTTLRLVDADGTLVHQWSFEPIAETCRARRRDYFARYVITVPATAAAGPHRVELVVTDTLSGEIARGELPLAILPAAE